MIERVRGEWARGAAGLLLLGLLGCGPPSNDDREQLQLAQQLRFVVQPILGRAGEPLAPALTVEILDQNGERVRGLETVVDLSLPSRASGTNLVNAVAISHDGLASFPFLTILHVGAYELEATSAGLTPARSETVTILPANDTAMGGRAP